MVQFNVEKLKQSTENNRAADAVFKSLQARKRDRRITDLRQYHVVLARSGHDIDMNGLINVFKKMQDAGAGSLVFGRGSKPPRFIWNYSLKSIGAAIATPEAAERVLKIVHDKPKKVTHVSKPATVTTPVATKEKSNKIILAVMPLRDDFRIRLTLPGDITKQEVALLVDFIKSLPADGDQ